MTHSADPASRRRALLERFTSGSLERLERIRAALDAMARGRADGEHVRMLLREMHTLKGEARMMGFPLLGDAGHHGERLLRADPGVAPSAATLNALLRLIAATAGVLRDPDSEAAAEVLRTACDCAPVSWPGGGPADPVAPADVREMPAPGGPSGPATQLELPNTRPRPLRILLVDDSALIRELVGDVLGRRGYQVTEAADGEAALRAVEVAPPDLILLDIDMPRMTGFQVLHQLSRREHRCPVVMLTSHASDDDRAQAKSLGAADYVVKSGFRDEALLEIVQRNLPGGGAR